MGKGAMVAGVLMNQHDHTVSLSIFRGKEKRGENIFLSFPHGGDLLPCFLLGVFSDFF